MPIRINAGKYAKSFNADLYTLSQIKQIENDFKKHVKNGGNNKDFIIPKWYEMDKPKLIEKPASIEEKEVMKEISYLDHFKTLHISDIKPPFENGGVSFCLIGSTRSGKSYAMDYIFNHWFKKHITFLMTLSTHSPAYKNLEKHKNVLFCEGFNKQLIEEPMTINKNTKNNYDFLCVFDDLSLDGKNDESMTKLLTIGRNSGMSAIIAGQKMTMLSSTGRTNCNYILCMKLNTESAIEEVIKTYLRSFFPKDLKMNDMISLYKELTNDYHFFLVDTLNDKCYLSKI